MCLRSPVGGQCRGKAYLAEGPAPSATMSAGAPAATTRPPSSPASGAELDDVVGDGDNPHIQLDHDDGVAGIDEALQVSDETVGIGAVQPRRRLVEHVERVSAL